MPNRRYHLVRGGIGGDLETGTANAAVGVQHRFVTPQYLNSLRYPGAQALITRRIATINRVARENADEFCCCVHGTTAKFICCTYSCLRQRGGICVQT